VDRTATLLVRWGRSDWTALDGREEVEWLRTTVDELAGADMTGLPGRVEVR
jgi:hypothetical protein